MFNSKYIGSEVEQLLDQVSGKTVYTAGSGITISDEGVISAEGGSGGGESELSGYTTTEHFDRLEKTVSTVLYDYKDKIRDRYTKKQSDAKHQPKGKYISKTEAKKAYYNNDYIDSRLRVISAALNELSDRISALEGVQ